MYKGNQMTKEKKLELQKYKEKTKNMTDEQKKIYDKLLSMQERIESFTRELHTLIFPEEYDFMYDSVIEAKERRKGIHQKEVISKASTQETTKTSLLFLPTFKKAPARTKPRTMKMEK